MDEIIKKTIKNIDFFIIRILDFKNTIIYSFFENYFTICFLKIIESKIYIKTTNGTASILKSKIKIKEIPKKEKINSFPFQLKPLNLSDIIGIFEIKSQQQIAIKTSKKNGFPSNEILFSLNK